MPKNVILGDEFIPEIHLRQPTIIHKIFETDSSFHAR